MQGAMLFSSIIAVGGWMKRHRTLRDYGAGRLSMQVLRGHPERG